MSWQAGLGQVVLVLAELGGSVPGGRLALSLVSR